MEIALAKSAGFCFGVKNAVEGVYEELKNQPLVTYGPIIHNKHVTEDLEANGVRIIENFGQLKNETVVIRCHGVPLDVFEYMDKNNINYIDYTCPYVKKIHKKVKQNQDSGYEIIIIGDKNHPEVIGIHGHAQNKALIIKDSEEAKNISFDKSKKYVVVVQTTYKKNVFEDTVAIIKASHPEIEIHNTICNATSIRQEEAIKLSQNVQHMIVLGDKSSSNSTKLYEVCKNNCKNTYFIENISEIRLNIFKTNDRIGITAGASTPPAVIKEALYNMNENDKNNQTFEEMLDSSFITLHTGDVVKGSIIQITHNEVSVNLGYKSDGVISKDEMSDDPSFDPKAFFNIGDEVEAIVLRVNDGEGNVLLSRKRIADQKNIALIEEAFNNKSVVKGKVVDTVKGGLMVMICDVKVFVPSSQISSRFVDDLTSFKGCEFDFNIIEFNREKRRMVAGRKELAQQEERRKKQAALEKLEAGMEVEGTVSRIVGFGVFVDLGDIDGLIHITELSWVRNRKPSSLFAVGDKVRVLVLNVDREKEKVSLSAKALEGDPWADIEEKYAVDQVVEGKIVRMIQFGAFVELESGVDGLIHISQISRKRIGKVEDVLKIGEIVNVKIIGVDKENKKISLSKKEVDEPLGEDESSPKAADEAECSECTASECGSEEACTEECATPECCAEECEEK